MRAKLIKKFGDLPVGSSISVLSFTDHEYTGWWSSMFGTFVVVVPKDHCHIEEKNEKE